MNIFDNLNSETATTSSLIDASDRTLDLYSLVPTLLNKREPGAALNSLELSGKNHVNTAGIDRSDRGLFTIPSYPSQFDVSEADQSAGGDLITGGDTGENQLVQAAIQTAEDLLNKFAVDPDFITKMQTAFGNGFDARKTGFFADSWRNGELGRLPGIEVRSQSALAGANGAFAAATNTIYLAQEFVEKNSGDVKAVASVFLEEYGHFIDSQINTTDAAGDEGEIFAALVQGKDLSASDVLVLKGEDDSAIIVLDGEEVRIERAETTSKKDTLNFYANNLGNWSNGEESKTIPLYEWIPEKPITIPLQPFRSSSVDFDAEINSKLQASVFVNPKGNYGEATFEYPVDVAVQLPKQVELGEKFSIIPGVGVKNPSASLEKSKGFELPNAGFKFEVDRGSTKLSNLTFKTPSGNFPSAGVEISPTKISAVLDVLSIKGELSILEGIGTLSASFPKLEQLKSATPRDNTDPLLPDITASGRSNNIIEGAVDLDKILFPPYGLAIPDVEIPIIPRTNATFSYDFLDIKSTLGLALQQDFTFDPEKVEVTMSVKNQAEQKGVLGSQENKFEFQAPSEGSGILKVKAKYELFGKVRNDIGLILQSSLLDIKALQGQLGLEVVALDVEDVLDIKFKSPPIQIGPVLSVQVPDGGAAIPLVNYIGSPQEKPTDPKPLNPILKTLNPSDPKIGIELDDSNAGKATKNLIVEVEYEIPYNLPFSISDARATEGNNLVFTVSRREPSNEAVNLIVEYENGNATAGEDYFPGQRTITIPAGQISADITVPTTGDNKQEPTETFKVKLKKPDGSSFATDDPVTTIDATGIIIDDDEKPKKPDDGGSTYNDPRIVTIDKQYHDFQAVGEFTLVESTSGDLKIQVRQEPLGSDRLGSVTENTAVSTVLGGKRIGIYRDRGLLIDGIPTNIANNDSLIIGDGRIYREGSTYTVVYRTGDQLVASVGSRVNINVFLTKERQGQIKGLFGNFNGDPKDDLAKRDGTVLSTPIPFRQLYGEYADSWRISQGESLFDYKSGEDTNTFTNKNFPRQKVTLKDLSAADIQKAEELIGNSITNPAIREAAIIDLVLTNFDPSIVEAAIASQTPDSILAIAIPPRAFEDFGSTFVNTPVKINVVENDEGTLGVPLAIANFDATTTKGGNIKLDDNATPDNKSDDQLIYTPPANFTGIDTFNYTLTDGKETSTSKVTISVPAFNLSTLNGSNGFVLNGSNAGNFTGVSTSSIGDFNSDGFDDLIIGAFGADPNGNNAAGESYVLFGSKAGFPVNFNPANLNGSNGFIINGVDTNGFSGGAVSSAGDVNGDGIDDLAIGVFGATANGKNNAGKTYIVFGSKNPFPVRFNLSELNGNNGFVFNGNNEFDYVGLSISKLGDLNGDSLDDLLVNAPGPLNSSAGKSYIIYGRKGSFSPSLNTSDINGTNGFVINDTDGNSGSSVKGVGDINGDGMADLIIGTDAANPDNNTPGKIQVLFGSRTGFPAVVNRSELNGKNGFIIEGVEINTSTFVSGAGDINGDGINDLIIGVADATANNNSAAGKTYIVFGKKAEFAPLVNLNQLNGSNGFVINGTQIEERSGISVDGAGDINGDGFDDIIIGASGASANGNNAAGKSYILFGSNQAFPASFNLAELNGNNGFIFNGATADDLTGTAVSSAGDINGDGLGDLIIGTPGSLFNNAPGKSYVVFGNTAFGGVYKPSSDPADLELVQTISNKTPYIGDEVTLKYTLTNKGKGVARRIKITDLLPPGVSFLSAATDQGIYDSNTGMWELGNIRENLSRTLDIVVKVEKTGSLVTTGQVTAVRETDPDSIPNNNNPAEDDQDSEEFGVAGGGGLTLVFDERYYLAQHADVKAAVEKRKFKNGFSHFVRHGEKENRDFRVLVFDESYYLAQNPDVKAAVEKRKFRSGLRHFIEWGQFEEQRKPNSFDPTAKRLQFDEDYYLQQNSDVEKAVEKRKFRTGFAHFIEWGQIEGRKPSLTGVNLLPG